MIKNYKNREVLEQLKRDLTAKQPSKKSIIAFQIPPLREYYEEVPIEEKQMADRLLKLVWKWSLLVHTANFVLYGASYLTGLIALHIISVIITFAFIVIPLLVTHFHDVYFTDFGRQMQQHPWQKPKRVPKIGTIDKAVKPPTSDGNP